MRADTIEDAADALRALAQDLHEQNITFVMSVSAQNRTFMVAAQGNLPMIEKWDCRDPEFIGGSRA